MSSEQWAFFILVFIGLAIYVYISSNIKAKRSMMEKLKRRWGALPEKEYSVEEFENISHLFRNSNLREHFVDDITWNDLDMDQIFLMINNTNSSVGQEYLYKMLRMPEADESILSERNRLAEFFRSNEKERTGVQKLFAKLGYSKKVSVADYIQLITDLVPEKNYFHYFCNLFLVFSVLFCILKNPQLGILMILISSGVSIVSYYKIKGRVESYFICISHVVRIINCANALQGLEIKELEEYNGKLKGYMKQFESIVKGSRLLNSGNMDGSLAEIILDYVRMMTHIDLIKFNKMVIKINAHEQEISEMIQVLGLIEASIAIASFRELLPYWTTPLLSKDKKGRLNAKDIYHPLIENPVVNSISEKRPVLLTGSNASGKSTFLKTVAINAILSQTIYTSTANSYEASYFNIYSSMSLRDSLDQGESYYIVEIKSLKRILDAIEVSEIPVLCFVDEVLRGTNTVERIAASARILHSLAIKNVMAFAATHDIELTTILEKYYANYHFQEDVSDNDVKFNYKLFKGRATSRNAIKLLGIIGYDQEIIQSAERMAELFVKEGKWRNME